MDPHKTLMRELKLRLIRFRFETTGVCVSGFAFYLWLEMRDTNQIDILRCNEAKCFTGYESNHQCEAEHAVSSENNFKFTSSNMNVHLQCRLHLPYIPEQMYRGARVFVIIISCRFGKPCHTHKRTHRHTTLSIISHFVSGSESVLSKPGERFLIYCYVL